MTTLARTPGVRAGMAEPAVASPLAAARLLPARLRQESERQVAFSGAKLLFREAASTIERLEGELARLTAEVEKLRAKVSL